MDELFALAPLMAQQGIRRLLVLSGEPDWAQTQAAHFRARAAEPVLWVGPQAQAAPWCPPGKLVTLLGREFQHAIFDARQGFDVAAFAALAGTLRAGSWLLLLVPEWESWPHRVDRDSLRWSDAADAIATPIFVHHFRRVMGNHAQALLWRQDQPFPPIDLPPRPYWRRASGEPDAEQATILRVLADGSAPAVAVTAERGRGKSALAGMHVRSLQGQAIVTAPTRASAAVIADFAGERFRFMAPDALLASDEKADWLIVDEAAAIPAPVLEQLAARFPRILMTTTVQGYEGTGRGFLLKFCARFPTLRQFTLTTPIRWAKGCPLEALVSELLIFNDELFNTPPAGELAFRAVEQALWLTHPALPVAMYQLLSGAHYRTSPLDLRRMMDAPGQHFIAAQSPAGLAGALWLVEEGGLSAQLSQAVWAGFRRPRGNLVAQSLAAHGGSPQAATLLGRRISRVAVHPLCQRAGIGSALIARACEAAEGCDYLSVSFGYTETLWRFWQRCGFTLVRIGTQREASSGCYAAMALYPLTEAGKRLAQHEHLRLCQQWPFLSAWVDEKLVLPKASVAMLNDEAWWDVAGFAFAHRPLLATLGNLHLLASQSALPLVALRRRLEGVSEAELCAALGIQGRKALLIRLRDEAAQGMAELDPERTARLRQQIMQIQFF